MDVWESDPRQRPSAGTTAPSAEASVEIHHELDRVRPEWDELAPQTGNVFATWEWAAAWRRHLEPRAPLTIILLRRPDGSPQALVPLYLGRRRPVRLLRFVGAGPADELGPVCAPADRRAAVEALRQHAPGVLSSGGVLVAERLPSADGIGAELGGVIVNRSASPLISIEERSFDDYLRSRSRSFRGQARRRERRLMREHRLEYRLTQDPKCLDRDLGILMRLHAERWTGRHSRAFVGGQAAFHRDFARWALEQGWLRLWTMWLDGEPAAAWYGLRYGTVESYYQAGWSPSLSPLSVGFVLLCHTIRSAFEDGMDEYRFGLGGEAYKSRFTDLDPGLETVAVGVGLRGALGVAGLSAGMRLRRRLRSSAG